MVPTRILRVSGEQLMDFFRQDAEKTEFLLRQASPFGMPSGAVSSANLSSDSIAPATSTSTVPQPANAMNCCCSAVPALLSIFALQDLASFLRPFGSKRQSRAPLHHPTDALQNSQKHLFRSTKIAFLQKFTELFR